MLIITGGVFLILALLSGIALLASPFGFTGADNSINWLSFPLFAILGPSIFMFSPDTARAAKICGVSGAMLVTLGLAGLIAAFLVSNGMLAGGLNAPPVTSSLWYVAAVGLIFGSGAMALKTLLDRRQAAERAN